MLLQSRKSIEEVMAAKGTSAHCLILLYKLHVKVPVSHTCKHGSPYKVGIDQIASIFKNYEWKAQGI